MTSGEAEKPVEGPLSGRQYVITGTLEGFSRDEAKQALEALGAKVSDSVSKKTAGVIVGESPGTKVAKAQKAGVPVLTEADLRALLGARDLRLARRREHGDEAVLCPARRPGGDGRPVLDHGERDRVADDAGERARDARRPGLAAHPPAERGETVAQRPVAAGDGE